jgi:secreted trypsin-like serine protease
LYWIPEKQGWAQGCAGALVRPDVVLTAAHCVSDEVPGPVTKETVLDPESLRVVLDRSDLRDTGGEVIAVEAVWVSTRASWSGGAVKAGDFAILDLASPSTQMPVKLPRWNDAHRWAVDTPLYAVGWGCEAVDVRTEDCVERDSALKAITLRVLESSACRGMDPRTELCAGASGAKASTCPGDSGGPLTSVGADNRRYLVGLVSWGPATCEGAEVEALVGAIMDPDGRSWVDPLEEWHVRRAGAQ